MIRPSPAVMATKSMEGLNAVKTSLMFDEPISRDREERERDLNGVLNFTCERERVSSANLGEKERERCKTPEVFRSIQFGPFIV